jgi:hypothetical protein
MRKPFFLKLLLAMGVLLLISSFSLGHFTTIPDPIHGFLKGCGVTLIVAYFLKASLTKTVW